MKAGKLRDRIEIQEFVSTKDAAGGQVKAWRELVTVYAQVIYGTGQERREAAQETASAPATFLIRKSRDTAAVGVGYRIVFAGANWDITSAVPSKEWNVGIDITAVRKAA